MLSKFFEFKEESDFKPIKSFYLKDELNPKIWDNFEIDENIKEDLLKIADDYIKNLDLDIDINDIVLTGSLANFNWSDYSDFDLHIIFDFSEINKDEVLVKKYLDSVEKLWKEYHDILISGYEVELYCQDIKEKHNSTGIFSLLNNEWIKKPTRENFIPDEDLIRIKAESIMTRVDDIEDESEHEYEYKELSEKLKRVWKKIKENRQKGLDKEGEFSTENLVFKLLRRNGYIKKIIDLKTKIYDKQYK